MKKIIIAIIILLIINIAISAGIWYLGSPVTFKEFKAFNTTIRCVFWGAKQMSCWEHENITNGESWK